MIYYSRLFEIYDGLMRSTIGNFSQFFITLKIIPILAYYVDVPIAMKQSQITKCYLLILVYKIFEVKRFKDGFLGRY